MNKMRKLERYKKRYPEGTVLFRENDHSSEIYILLKGKVSVIKGGKVIAKIEEEGTYIGEMSALLGHPRSATVRTDTYCEFIVFPGEKLERVIQLAPQVGVKLIKTMASRLDHTTDERVEYDIKADMTFDKAKETYQSLVYLLESIYKKRPEAYLRVVLEYARSSYLTAPEKKPSLPVEIMDRVMRELEKK